MAFQIVEKIQGIGSSTTYKFNAISERDGIRFWLTEYLHEVEGMRPKKWAYIGDDGSFVKREQIAIPSFVAEAVKRKAAESFYFDG